MSWPVFWLLIGIIIFLLAYILTEPLERIDEIKMRFKKEKK